MSESASRAVFLSYASQDAEVVRRICEALRAAGIEVWFDQNELIGGDAWDAKIRKQIRECAIFVPIISAATQARREGYFRLEWKLGAQRTHMMAAGTPFLLPVIIDATRDAEALVPEEFREVQWTRLPAGETPATFAERVKRLAENPASSSAPGEAAAPPFVFGGRNFPNAAQLATGLVLNWPEATRRWVDGSILEWVARNSDDAALVRRLREITPAGQLDAGQKLAVALLALNPNLPLIWQGEVITEAWLAARPELAGKLCDSAVPAWLKKIRGDDWLEICATRRKKFLAEMPTPTATVDRALIERLIFGPIDAVETQVTALVETFSGLSDPVIHRLLNQEELTLGEAMLLLAVPREVLVKAGSATPSATTAPMSVPPAEPVAESFVELLSLAGGHTAPVQGVTFSAGVRWLVSGGTDAQIIVWDPHSGAEVRRMTGVAAAVGCVGFAPDGRSLASGGADGFVRFWELSLGRELRGFAGHQGLVSSVAYSPNGRLLASGGADRLVILWDPWSGKELRRMHGHLDWIASVAFSADGRCIGSGSADNSIRLWDVESGRELRRLEGHTGTVHSVAFSPDGKYLASGGADHSVRVWDATTGKELRQLAGHSRAVQAVAFSPTKPWLATASADRTVRIWDPVSGRELQRLESHTNAVRCVAFSRDGRWLASGSADHSIGIWNLVAEEAER